jgi:mannose-6-phosphate isomerase-like protein (cupin superfamily)
MDRHRGRTTICAATCVCFGLTISSSEFLGRTVHVRIPKLSPAIVGMPWITRWAAAMSTQHFCHLHRVARLLCNASDKICRLGVTIMAESLSALLERQVARWTDRVSDWDAFADARVDGYRRAQHRFIGYGASGKTDGRYIPAEHFTLSVMFVPPGQGNAAHTHEVEEIFFILRGKVRVFFQDERGQQVDAVLGEWDCVSCPANVIHGYENVGLEPAYLQVMLGKGRPDLMSYTDRDLQSQRDVHLSSEGASTAASDAGRAGARTPTRHS